jgi:hypothetical protein
LLTACAYPHVNAINIGTIYSPRDTRPQELSGTLEIRDEPTLARAVPKPGRPRSGYGRLRLRHRHLIEMHEQLVADHEKLQREHAALRVGHDELQSAFDELLQIHNSLIADLKQSHQVRSAASNLAGLGLMGQRHG